MYKRVFTKNDTNLNYQDYNKLISGIETLKTIKMADNLAVLKQFKNYQNWQTLNSAYFPFIDNNSLKINNLKNIFHANESFIDKDYEINTCNKDILYPYGKIVSKKITNPQFPTNIYLCRWCNNKPKHIETTRHVVYEPYNKCCKKTSCNCSNNCCSCNCSNNCSSYNCSNCNCSNNCSNNCCKKPSTNVLEKYNTKCCKSCKKPTSNILEKDNSKIESENTTQKCNLCKNAKDLFI